VTRIVRRNGVGLLPRGTRMRKVHTKRYKKQVPGHHIQMDVKFLTFIGKRGEKIRRFQYTALTLTTFRYVPWNTPFYRSCGFELVNPIGYPMLLATMEAEREGGLPLEQRCGMVRQL